MLGSRPARNAQNYVRLVDYIVVLIVIATMCFVSIPGIIIKNHKHSYALNGISGRIHGSPEIIAGSLERQNGFIQSSTTKEVFSGVTITSVNEEDWGRKAELGRFSTEPYVQSAVHSEVAIDEKNKSRNQWTFIKY